MLHLRSNKAVFVRATKQIFVKKQKSEILSKLVLNVLQDKDISKSIKSLCDQWNYGTHLCFNSMKLRHIPLSISLRIYLKSYFKHCDLFHFQKRLQLRLFPNNVLTIFDVDALNNRFQFWDCELYASC